MILPARDLPPDMAAVMAACRLTIAPGDAQALADLRARAGGMNAVEGESAARRAFRQAAYACATDPSPVHLSALARAMNDFNRSDLLPLARPPEDPRPRRAWAAKPGRPAPAHTRNGVAAALPRDPDDINTDL